MLRPKHSYKPQAVPSLNQIAGLHKARLAHHHIYNVLTQEAIPEEGGQITKKCGSQMIREPN